MIDVSAFKWNDKQFYTLMYWANKMPKRLILDGAVRSGKTITNLFFWIIHISQSKGTDFIVTGQSLGAIERNIIKPLNDIFGIDTILQGQSDKHFKLNGKLCHCFGSTKRDSHAAITGMTSYGHLGNEIIFTHPNVVKEVAARCNGEDSRFFWDTNPTTPSHFIYQEYIKQYDRRYKNIEYENVKLNINIPQLADGRLRVNFSLYDNSKDHNGFLDPEYIADLEKEYRGIWKEQKILGRWKALEGQVYFIERLNYYDRHEFLLGSAYKSASIYAHYDPATGSNRSHGCYDALIVAAIVHNDIYVLDAVIRKVGILKMPDILNEIVAPHRMARISVEDNFSQKAYVVETLKSKLPHLPIYGQSAVQPKADRLIGMSNIVYNRVYFPDDWTSEMGNDGALLLRQLCNITPELEKSPEYPDQFVDGPDALEGLIKNISKTGNAVSSGGGKERKFNW